ncbi:hypothetical protein CMO93_05885 [Candidatus Woesearchaeota archaeon]|nr:hypothetical protein [Candidatus Woesearchaeota archaeon]|tara:strand:+ start:1080 stop:1691 length:612 start_codon:yes stop_codon:yes gene_type:complete
MFITKQTVDKSEVFLILEERIDDLEVKALGMAGYLNNAAKCKSLSTVSEITELLGGTLEYLAELYLEAAWACPTEDAFKYKSGHYLLKALNINPDIRASKTPSLFEDPYITTLYLKGAGKRIVDVSIPKLETTRSDKCVAEFNRLIDNQKRIHEGSKGGILNILDNAEMSGIPLNEAISNFWKSSGRGVPRVTALSTPSPTYQ